MAERPGLDVLAVVLIGGVTYDGLSGVPFWRNDLAGPMEDTVRNMGVGWDLAETLVGTFGLVAVVLLMGWAYHVACTLAVSVSEARTSVARVRLRFAHSLVPIALAYAFRPLLHPGHL